MKSTSIDISEKVIVKHNQYNRKAEMEKMRTVSIILALWEASRTSSEIAPSKIFIIL